MEPSKFIEIVMSRKYSEPSVLQTSKYELITENTRTIRDDNGILHTVYQIRALKDFDDIKKGDLGGYVESIYNLDSSGTCWLDETCVIYGNAILSGDARMFTGSRLYGNARVENKAHLYSGSEVYDSAKVVDNASIDGAKIYGNARVSGSAVVSEKARVHGGAKVGDIAWVRSHAEVFSLARVCGNSEVAGKAKVCGNACVHGISIIGGMLQFKVMQKYAVMLVYLMMHLSQITSRF